MSSNNPPAASQIRDDTTQTSEQDSERIFIQLRKDLACLHLINDEYLALFDSDPAHFELFNCAPKFFSIIQASLWNDILLGITRISDSESTLKYANLTVQRLPGLLPELSTHEDIEKKLAELLEKVAEATKFAFDWRNRRIAHRDLFIAINDQNVRPLAKFSLKHVSEALSALGNVLNLISTEYGYGGNTVFRPVSNHRGAASMLDYLKEGVEAVEKKNQMMLENTKNIAS